MADETMHPSDRCLLLLADGELASRDASGVRAHLAACGDCRTRMAKIEKTMAESAQVNRPELPRAAWSRARLRMRLAELARGPGATRWQKLRLALTGRSLAYASGIALCAALGAGFLYQAASNEAAPRSEVGVLPSPTLTPGATRPVAIAAVCAAEHDEVVREVPAALRREVFEEYGMANAPSKNYEVDYLISPGLGGADDIRNLWPEPRYNTKWNSFVKDQLEERLHHLVCSGEIDLPTAQREIAGNWIAAYKETFDTDEPLKTNLSGRASRIPRRARFPAPVQDAAWAYFGF